MTRYWTRQMEQCVSGRGPSRAAAGLSLGGLLLWGVGIRACSVALGVRAQAVVCITDDLGRGMAGRLLQYQHAGIPAHHRALIGHEARSGS